MKQIDDFTDSVISRLETARIKAGMTTQELIQKSGLRRSTYFRKMRGITDFTTSDIDALAKALDLDPILLLIKAGSDKPQDPIDWASLPEDIRKELALSGMFGFAANDNPDKENEKRLDADD